MNRVSIPQVNANVISDEDFPRVMNQIQQNIIDGIDRIQVGLVPVTSSIGDTVLSPLTLAQFQSQRGKGWILSDGANVQGSLYQKITGSPTVPDQTADYPNANPYIRVN